MTFPACRGCVWKIRLRRLVSVMAMWASVVVAVCLLMRCTEGWQRLLRRLTVIVESRFPPGLRLTLEGDTLVYEFRNVEFSCMFRMKNLDALKE